SSGEPTDIRFFDLKSDGQPVLRRRILTEGHPAFARDARSIAAQDRLGIISVIDVATGARAWTDATPAPRVTWTQFSADCRWLAYYATPWGVVVRDAATGYERARFPEYGERPVQRLALSPDGSTLAVHLAGGLGQVVLHD